MCLPVCVLLTKRGPGTQWWAHHQGLPSHPLPAPPPSLPAPPPPACVQAGQVQAVTPCAGVVVSWAVLAPQRPRFPCVWPLGGLLWGRRAPGVSRTSPLPCSLRCSSSCVSEVPTLFFLHRRGCDRSSRRDVGPAGHRSGDPSRGTLIVPQGAQRVGQVRAGQVGRVSGWGLRAR